MLKIVAKAILTSSIILSTPALASDPLKAFIPPECLPDKCFCYYPQAVDKLSERIIACQKNSIELKAKQDWIREHLADHPSNNSWWQEPHAIIGGIVVTASITTAVTMWTMWRVNK